MSREHESSAHVRAGLDRRQLLLAAGLGLPVVGSLTGRAAAQDAAAGGTLIFNGGANLSGLDPHTTGATVSWYVLDNVFDRLVRLDPETSEPVPSLAKEISISDDGLEIIFTLRQGVTFHNGRELTAADVKYSFERIMDPDVPAVAKGYFDKLETIETPDDYTVRLIYSEVFAPLLMALTRLETAIVPQEEVEQTEQWETHPVGSGPFRFDSYVPDQAAVLVRNENYWEEGLPLLDRVEQRIIPERETASVNLQTGDLHITEVQAQEIESLDAAEGVSVQLLTSTLWPHLSMNTQQAPFDNLQVRQAIRLGFNRDDIHQLGFFGTGIVSNTMLPEGNPFRSEVEGWTYDPERARSLLAEAGFADGFSATLRIIANTPWALSAAQIVQAYLQELNIVLEIEQMESTAWFSEVFNNSEFEMTMVAHGSKVDPDLSMFDILHSGELGTKNYTQFNDPEMDQLLDQGRATIDPDERFSIYAEAQRVFVERSGYVVLNLQEMVWGVRDDVENFTVLPTVEVRWKETSLNS
jgi:peptide/nickel transport system substrate-binding protein